MNFRKSLLLLKSKMFLFLAFIHGHVLLSRDLHSEDQVIG